MVSYQHICLHRTVTCILLSYPNNKDPANLQTIFRIIPGMPFDATLPFSTASNTSYLILVSHPPDDAIIVSSCFPLNAELNDKFIQPPTEQVLQLVSKIEHKPTKHTTSITPIQRWCRLHKKTSKLHQSNPAYCPAICVTNMYDKYLPFSYRT